MAELIFPQGFLWGTATAAHQVEGDNNANDWWDWELAPGHIKNEDRSTMACDWWHGKRYREDFDLAQSLHLNAQRLSVEWSRVEPREGEWNADAIVFYRDLLNCVREHGMRPLVTLHHFSNPHWLAQRGAWETPASVPFFERFVQHVVQELGDLCDFWVTINEPIVYTYAGYADGIWPPGKRDFGLAMRVAANLLRAHAAAYHAIHRIQPAAHVGLAHNLHKFRPANGKSPLNRTIVWLQDRIYNQAVLKSLADGRLHLPLGREKVEGLEDSQDYIGLNYYFSTRVAVDWSRPNVLFGKQLPAEPWGVPYDDELDRWWGKGTIDPDGFYQAIMSLIRFEKPIYITENGICDRYDELRPSFLLRHLSALQRAIRDGAPVKGYFYWTLVDNFEWVEGYSLRFGLIANDIASQKRTLKPSALMYGQIAAANRVLQEPLLQSPYQ